MPDQERYIELKAAVEYFLMVQGGVRAIADHGAQLTDSLWQQYFRAVEDLERLVGWNDDEEERDEL